jgi:hypothetical protein
MTNAVPITYYNNFAGLFADSGGGWAFTSGQMSVLIPVIVGVHAYSTKSSFVNTIALNGVGLTDLMTVVAVYGTGRAYPAYANVVVQPASCVSGNSAVFACSPVSSGCSVVLVASSGSSSVSITASYSGFSASVAYRAYKFSIYSLNATRTQLRRLGCDYETAYLTAYGTVTIDGVTSLATIDISSVVTITSSSPSVISVS